MNRASGTSYRGTTFSERMADAPCMETDPDLSFPNGKGKFELAYADAKKACARCPLQLREDCLEVAMKGEGNASAASRYGVFAGLDPEERWALARERKARAESLPDLVWVEQPGLTASGANQTPVGPALGHVRSLLDAGHTRTAIANASGLSHSVICMLATSSPRFIKGSTYVALMSVREASEVAA